MGRVCLSSVAFSFCPRDGYTPLNDIALECLLLGQCGLMRLVRCVASAALMKPAVMLPCVYVY